MSHTQTANAARSYNRLLVGGGRDFKYVSSRSRSALSSSLGLALLFLRSAARNASARVRRDECMVISTATTITITTVTARNASEPGACVHVDGDCTGAGYRLLTVYAAVVVVAAVATTPAQQVPLISTRHNVAHRTRSSSQAQHNTTTRTQTDVLVVVVKSMAIVRVALALSPPPSVAVNTHSKLCTPVS
jgi:hypothetical protein